jgi:hypothetical protein
LPCFIVQIRRNLIFENSFVPDMENHQLNGIMELK